ncbi:MAG: peptide chain release factor N(5)-glutamine methyltransferase [Verrucomicrobiaceae bacterium]|nr:peptide chain release factor N(5)-glutamine methyltransferase [Verrucomicrobiaceae bacterium]
MKTLLDTLQGGTKYLEARGVEDARLNMEYLLAKVLQCERMDLYLDFDRPLVEAELVPLRELLRDRGERQPLQHLLGEVEFHGRRFRSDGRGLIPRPETEELVGIMIARFALGEQPATVVDVGCGSGVIGLSLGLEWQGSTVTLIDISADALALASENAQRHTMDCGKLIFVEGDLISGVPGPFDLVIANLPYVSTGEIAGLEAELSHDPRLALDGGEKGIEIIERLISQLPGKIAPGGLLALEFGEGQGDSLSRMLSVSGFNDCDLVKDMAGIERFILAKA